LFLKDPLARNLHSDPKGYSLSIWLPLISFILRVIHLKHHLLQEKETKGEKTVLLMLTHNTKKDNLQKKNVPKPNIKDLPIIHTSSVSNLRGSKTRALVL